MRPETDGGSMKVLLKQVYGVHTAKVKSLEDEIEELKKNLLETENKLKSIDSECKRCIELEEAFNSCKAALHEQSKWFENLGQKFSTSSTSENKTSGEKDIKGLVESTISCDEETNTQVAPVKKIDLSLNPKMHFLKNIMSLNTDAYQESLDLSTAPFQRNAFQEYSTLNPDSLVLVPNTLDIMSEVGTKTCQANSNANNEIKNSNVPNIDRHVDSEKHEVNTTLKSRDPIKNPDSKGKSRKRSDSTRLEPTSEVLDKEKETKSHPANKKMKSSGKSAEDDTFVSTILPKSNENISPKNQKSNIDVEQSSNNNIKKNNTPALNVKIRKVVPDGSFNKSSRKKITEVTRNGDGDNSKDDFQVTVSPSLLPLNEKTNKALNNPPLLTEDINDFDVPSLSKKISVVESSWTSCNKKKNVKKALNLKPFKPTSKFKIQLDSLPPNYKKPAYRQTKLSKSLFQPKSSSLPKEEFDVQHVDVDEKSSDFEINLPSTSPDLQVTPGSSKTVDFDATCIPDNYNCVVISPKTLSRKGKNAKNRDFDNSIMIVKDSTDDSDIESSAEMIIEQPAVCLLTEKEGKISSVKSSHDSPNDIKNSFDRLPKKAEPNYKYKEETVRKKSERKQLTAFDCKECEKYYSELGLSDEEKQKRMHKCSRHRSKFAPPPTPEHFWELEFPDTQECKARGYLNETQKVQLKTHRKRRL